MSNNKRCKTWIAPVALLDEHSENPGVPLEMFRFCILFKQSNTLTIQDSSSPLEAVADCTGKMHFLLLQHFNFSSILFVRCKCAIRLTMEA